MPRSPETVSMQRALQDVVVAYLRHQGFKGAFPHYRRIRDTGVDLLSFQFSIQSPGGFYISIASGSPTGIVDGSGNLVQPDGLNAYYGVFNGTFKRLSPSASSDHAFIYKPIPALMDVYQKSPEVVSVYAGDDDGKYERIAKDVLALIEAKLDGVFTALEQHRLRKGSL